MSNISRKYTTEKIRKNMYENDTNTMQCRENESRFHYLWAIGTKYIDSLLEIEQQKAIIRSTRTRGGGRQKVQGGNLQQEVVWSGSPIKWSTPLALMETVKTQHIWEERWREYTKMMVLQQVKKLETNSSGTYEGFFWGTFRTHFWELNF